jgi:hypothetical protein
VNESAVRNLLKPFYKTLNDAVVDGYQDFLQAMGDDAIVYDSTTRANMAHNHIFHRISSSYEPGSRIRSINFSKLKMFKLDDRLLFKVKKLGKRLKSSNIPSKRNGRFLRQERLFNEMEPMTHLQLGYVVNFVGGAIIGVYIVCPESEHRNQWNINLFKELGYGYVPGLFDDLIVEDDQPDYGLPPLTFVTDEEENNEDEQLIQAV